MSNLAAQELQSFVRRIEALDDEIRALNSDKSEVFKEVKSAGFTAKTLRKVVAARRMDATERDQADEEFELYWNAVHGIEIDLVPAHVENIEEFDADGVFIESTAARKDVRQGNAGAERVDTPAPLTQQGFATPDSLGNEMGRPQSATLQSETGARASYSRADTLDSPAGTQAPPVDTSSNLTTLIQKPLRPYCQNPGNSCGGMGKKHCFKCQKAFDEQHGAA